MTAGADAIGNVIGQHNANSDVSFGAVRRNYISTD